MLSTEIRRLVKSTGKRMLRAVGIEAHSYAPGSSRDAQLMASLQAFSITDIIDIGANEGQFAQELFAAGFAGRLISIEPLVEAHSKLSAAASRNANWFVPEATAVGAKVGEIAFHVAENSVSSSALEVNESSLSAAPNSRQVSKRLVPLTTVDELCRSNKLPSSGVMLKVDTQVMNGRFSTGRRRAWRVRPVLLELPHKSLCRTAPLAGDDSAHGCGWLWSLACSLSSSIR
jgi:FkbM family methyltransferase